MIKVIYGKRGAGKTKRIVSLAKEEVTNSKGNVVFLEKDNRCMLDLPHDIRYVNAAEYDIKDPDVFFGFVSGMLAANFDIVDVFVDALPSIIGLESSDQLEKFFGKMKKLSEEMQVNMVLSVSAVDDGPMPAFLEPFVI